MTNATNYNENEYTVGDSDTRPWGAWEVLAVREENGEQVVEKKITITPDGILSLQSHKFRREKWTVLSGKIRVTRDDEIIDLETGQSIDIPQGAKHRMANPFDDIATVHEIQMGQCMESDIIRYEDKYGRA